MRKLLLVFIGMFCAASLYAEGSQEYCTAIKKAGRFRLGGGYGFLLNPNLDDIGKLPDSTVVKGGFAGGFQLLFGSLFDLQGVFWGVEADVVRTYHYKLTPPDAGTTKVTFMSIPISLIWEYDVIPKNSRIMPFIQWGLGASLDQLKTENPAGSDTHTSTDFVLSVGPGFGIILSDTVSLDTMLKYYLFFTTETSYTQTLNLTLNLSFRLW